MIAEGARTGLIFLLGLLFALALVPPAIAAGRRFGMQVRPRLHASSLQKVSYLGGVGTAAAAVLAIAIGHGLGPAEWAVLGGGAVVLLLGLVDDAKAPAGVGPKVRLLVQVAAAGGVWWFGLRGYYPAGPEAAFAVFVLVASANAFNLLDNMDGVAASTTLGTGSGIVLVGLFASAPEAVPVPAAVAGAAAGFLRYNVRPAKVYLGDSGALFLGFVLGAGALLAGPRLGAGWELVAVTTMLAVPATDVWVATTSRFLGGRALLAGGTDHASHRLARLGLSPTQVSSIHGCAALAAAGTVALSMETTSSLMVAAIALFALAGLGLLAVRPGGRARPRWGRRIVASIGIGVAAAILLAVPPAISGARRLADSRMALERAVSKVSDFDLRAAEEEFGLAAALAVEAEREMGSPLTKPVRLMPVARENVRAAKALAEGARLIAFAGRNTIRAAGAFPKEAGVTRVGLSQGSIPTQDFSEAAGHLDAAAAQVDRAVQVTQSTRGPLVGPVGSARRQFLDEGRGLRSVLVKAAEAARLLPVIFGSEGEKTWFLAIQNPVEVRATGGFLGAFGILRASEGRLRLAQLESNVALPDVAEPPVATEEFVARYGRFRARSMWQNVNMTPDFPTAARLMAEMWQRGTGELPDGVISVDATGLAGLLEVVGPVEVPGLGIIDHSNLAELALNEAYIRFPKKEDRAKALLEVGRTVWSRILAPEFTDLRALADPIARAVVDKHLMVWIPGHEAALGRLGVSGRVAAPGDADYLLVVGQNAAANKVDYYAKRRLQYRIEVRRDGSFTGRLDAVLENGTPLPLPESLIGPYSPTDPPGLNRSYLSVYPAPGTGILAAFLDGRPA
ncbi:MAG: DUF4012 domain-containing protein, partial [Actinomycetota bacterium]